MEKNVRVSGEVRSKLHNAVAKQEFLMLALTGMTERAEEEYNKDVWFGCFLIGQGIINEFKEVEALIGKE